MTEKQENTAPEDCEKNLTTDKSYSFKLYIFLALLSSFFIYFASFMDWTYKSKIAGIVTYAVSMTLSVLIIAAILNQSREKYTQSLKKSAVAHAIATITWPFLTVMLCGACGIVGANF